MASSVKRAATSATRSDPFEITMNWFIVQTSPSRHAAFSAQGWRSSNELEVKLDRVRTDSLRLSIAAQGYQALKSFVRGFTMGTGCFNRRRRNG
jgi:hypothetical protein